MQVRTAVCRRWSLGGSLSWAAAVRAFVSPEEVRTAHARVRRNFYSDFTAKRFVPRQANKRRRLSTSLENAHGTQPATRKLLLGACVLARAACFVAQQLNVKPPTRAERTNYRCEGGYAPAAFSRACHRTCHFEVQASLAPQLISTPADWKVSRSCLQEALLVEQRVSHDVISIPSLQT